MIIIDSAVFFTFRSLLPKWIAFIDGVCVCPFKSIFKPVIVEWSHFLQCIKPIQLFHGNLVVRAAVSWKPTTSQILINVVGFVIASTKFWNLSDSDV